MQRNGKTSKSGKGVRMWGREESCLVLRKVAYPEPVIQIICLSMFITIYLSICLSLYLSAWLPQLSISLSLSLSLSCCLPACRILHSLSAAFSLSISLSSSFPACPIRLPVYRLLPGAFNRRVLTRKRPLSDAATAAPTASVSV